MKTFVNFVRIASITYCLIFMYRVVFLHVSVFELNMCALALLFLTLMFIDQLPRKEIKG